MIWFKFNVFACFCTFFSRASVPKEAEFKFSFFIPFSRASSWRGGWGRGALFAPSFPEQHEYRGATIPRQAFYQNE
jgi:hypothetical protein